MRAVPTDRQTQCGIDRCHFYASAMQYIPATWQRLASSVIFNHSLTNKSGITLKQYKKLALRHVYRYEAQLCKQSHCSNRRSPNSASNLTALTGAHPTVQAISLL
jgi:hypothetical protein